MSPGNVEGDLKSQKLDEVVEVAKVVEEVNKKLFKEYNVFVFFKYYKVKLYKIRLEVVMDVVVAEVVDKEVNKVIMDVVVVDKVVEEVNRW